MTADEAFIEAIREEPDEDAPRLIYADWLEEQGQGESAEFIRVQCEAARLPRSDPRHPPLLERAGQILEAHWEEWVGPVRKAVGRRWDGLGNLWLQPSYSPLALGRYSRGFVDRLVVETVRLVPRPNAFAELAPLRHVGLWGAGPAVHALARSPYLAAIETLAFTDCFQAPLEDADVAALAESPYLGRLTTLSIPRSHITDEGLVALGSAPWLAGLRVLNVAGNDLTVRGLRGLVESSFLPRLTQLHLGNNQLGDAGVEVLAGSALVEEVSRLNLDRCGLGDRAIELLLASPNLRKLTWLSLTRNAFSARGLSRLRLSPLAGQLSHLEVDP